MESYWHDVCGFISETANLSRETKISYLHLVWHYYQLEAPMPDNLAVLSTVAGTDVATIQLILDRFFYKGSDGLWHNTDIDEQIRKTQMKSEARRKAAHKRWGKARG